MTWREYFKDECHNLGINPHDFPYTFVGDKDIDTCIAIKGVQWICEKRMGKMANNAPVKKLKGDQCQCCREFGENRRTLKMACFYNMDELNIPLTEIDSDQGKLYTLTVCKDCRGNWMHAIEKWFLREGEE
jgi:hypothetical protein